MQVVIFKYNIRYISCHICTAFAHCYADIGCFQRRPIIDAVARHCDDTTGILEYWHDTAAEVGPERVLFATGTPFTDAGILVSNVQYDADLDTAAKRKIYGDTLRRLLGNVA